jgi:hypothetical protein
MANFSNLAPTVHIVANQNRKGLMKRAIYTKTGQTTFNPSTVQRLQIAAGFPKVMLSPEGAQTYQPSL